jgi:hypothetical protein
MVHEALAQRAQLMRELRQMQRHHNSTQPVSVPSPIGPHHARVTLG